MHRPCSRDGGPVAPRAWRRLLVVLLVGHGMALAGCASAEEIRAETRSSQADVRKLSRNVLAHAVPLGRLVRPQGRWEGCGDLGGKALYRVTARLEATPEATGVLLHRVRNAMAAAGLRMRRLSPEQETVFLEVVRDEVNVQVIGREDAGFVLFDITGPCLEVGDLEKELVDPRPVPVRPASS